MRRTASRTAPHPAPGRGSASGRLTLGGKTVCYEATWQSTLASPPPRSLRPFPARLARSWTMTARDIEAAIPHRLPMRLLDEIVSQDEQRIVCKKTFSPEDFFVQGHFPDYPIVPGVIQCECCLQAGAVLLSRLAPRGDGMVPVATRMDGVKFKKIVRPGDTITIDVTLNDHVGNAFFLTGKVLLDDKLAARLDFACAVTALPTDAS